MKMSKKQLKKIDMSKKTVEEDEDGNVFHYIQSVSAVRFPPVRF